VSVRAELGGVAPFFIVKNVARAVAFYVDVLGFERRFAEPDDNPFFAIVGRDGAQLFLKHFDGDVVAQPNPTRHPGALWDAFVYVDDPDRLHAELVERDVKFRRTITNRTDGLRGFEVKDADGYVLFFGRPQP
jgi:catechol 2,3-dioxygenase-like lactoylglutathione lyase family enzyme